MEPTEAEINIDGDADQCLASTESEGTATDLTAPVADETESQDPANPKLTDLEADAAELVNIRDAIRDMSTQAEHGTDKEVYVALSPQPESATVQAEVAGTEPITDEQALNHLMQRLTERIIRTDRCLTLQRGEQFDLNHALRTSEAKYAELKNEYQGREDQLLFDQVLFSDLSQADPRNWPELARLAAVIVSQQEQIEVLLLQMATLGQEHEKLIGRFEQVQTTATATRPKLAQLQNARESISIVKGQLGQPEHDGQIESDGHAAEAVALDSLMDPGIE